MMSITHWATPTCSMVPFRLMRLVHVRDNTSKLFETVFMLSREWACTRVPAHTTVQPREHGLGASADASPSQGL